MILAPMPDVGLLSVTVLNVGVGTDTKYFRSISIHSWYWYQYWILVLVLVKILNDGTSTVAKFFSSMRRVLIPGIGTNI